MLSLKVGRPDFSVVLQGTLVERDLLTGQRLCPQLYIALLDTSTQQYGNTLGEK